MAGHLDESLRQQAERVRMLLNTRVKLGRSKGNVAQDFSCQSHESLVCWRIPMPRFRL